MSQTQLNNGKEFLSVRNLCVTFEDNSKRGAKIYAVKDVSFDVKEGEILSIAGESGSGKTTVARTIAALLPPTSGSVIYKGEDIAKKKKRKELQAYRREAQMIFQDPYESLNPRWDVSTTIGTHIRYLTKERDKKVIQDRIDQLLKEVGLKPDLVRHRLPHMLSGGERQRVNIARALSSNPKMLLGDEPITMLDASQRLSILRLLMKLKRERNLTILLITHDLASAKVASDHTIIMYKGEIVEAGPTDIVLQNPKHDYTKLILSSMPEMPA